MGIKAYFKQLQANRIITRQNKEEFKRFQYLRKEIQATEGRRDVLTWESIFEAAMNTTKQPSENNFKTYESQINAIHDMYYAKAKYGGEILRGLIDIQNTMICGEGINSNVFNSEEFLQKQESLKKEKDALQALEIKQPIAEKVNKVNEPIEEEIKDDLKEKTEKFIDKLFKDNKYNGSGIIKLCRIGLMEGKILAVLKVDTKNQKIKIETFSFKRNQYKIEKDSITGEITKITYGSDNKEIDIKQAVFIQLYGDDDDIDLTPPRIANVLTQIENYSRAKYDLRKNNHYYGKSMLAGETEDEQKAVSVKNDIKSGKFVPGEKGYVGPVKWSYITQSSDASTNIANERIMDIKDIATAINFPVFYFNYPELMSNRAVAETMLEMVNQATKLERLVIAEGITEIIQKAMILADSFDWGVNNPDGFDINLPLMTLDTIRSLVETWAMLWEKDLISKETVQGKIPGINPSDENKLIEKEKTENIKNNPILNGSMDNIINEPEENQDKDNNIQSWRFKNERRQFAKRTHRSK